MLRKQDESQTDRTNRTLEVASEEVNQRLANHEVTTPQHDTGRTHLAVNQEEDQQATLLDLPIRTALPIDFDRDFNIGELLEYDDLFRLPVQTPVPDNSTNTLKDVPLCTNNANEDDEFWLSLATGAPSPGDAGVKNEANDKVNDDFLHAVPAPLPENQVGDLPTLDVATQILHTSLMTPLPLDRHTDFPAKTNDELTLALALRTPLPSDHVDHFGAALPNPVPDTEENWLTLAVRTPLPSEEVEDCESPREQHHNSVLLARLSLPLPQHAV
ncbi:hypothetical protein HK102_002824 [Quaeritorhiza haematococci]|nr:hypothetical protein HK102_002824 [Quaeritorhiza haematococci]